MKSVAGVYTSLQQLIRLQHKARGFSFLPKQPIHSLLAGRHASRLRGRGLNFEEIRHYLPGDDIRNVDWKVTARTKKPHTKVFTEERDRATLLITDQRISMFFGSQVNMKSVTAAELAALAAWRVISAGDRVGAIVFNDHDMQTIKPQHSNDSVMNILNTLVEKNHALNVSASTQTNPGMLNQTLSHALRLAKHDFLICIISDFDGADEESKRLITLLSQHNDVIAALIYDELETTLPESEKLLVSDGKLQLEINTNEGSFRENFSDEFSQRLNIIKETLLKREIPVLTINTVDGVAEQVRHILGYSPKIN